MVVEVEVDEFDDDEKGDENDEDENWVKELAEKGGGKDGGRPVVTLSILATLIEFCRVVAPIFKVGSCW